MWRKNGQDIEKTGFCPFKGSQNKVFPIKKWHLKFSVLAFPKFAIFAKFSNNHVLSFSLMSDLCHINGTQ